MVESCLKWHGYTSLTLQFYATEEGCVADYAISKKRGGATIQA